MTNNHRREPQHSSDYLILAFSVTQTCFLFVLPVSAIQTCVVTTLPPSASKVPPPAHGFSSNVPCGSACPTDIRRGSSETLPRVLLEVLYFWVTDRALVLSTTVRLAREGWICTAFTPYASRVQWRQSYPHAVLHPQSR